MAGDIKQVFAGIRGTNDTRRILWHVKADSDTDALSKLNAAAIGGDPDVPLDTDGLPLMDSSVREIWLRPSGTSPRGLYECEGRYALHSWANVAVKRNQKPNVAQTTPELPTTPESSDKNLFSFDVSLRSEHFYQPDDTSDYVATPESGSVVNQATGAGFEEMDIRGFNFDPQYGYRGQELLVPNSVFTLDITPEDSLVTENYQNLVINTVGKVNNAVFRGHAAGEVMMVSARGESRNNSDWQFSFTYEVKKTRDYDFGNNVTISDVPGWDLVLPSYVYKTATVNGQDIRYQVCRQATQFRVYRSADLKAVLIGN